MFFFVSQTGNDYRNTNGTYLDETNATHLAEYDNVINATNFRIAIDCESYQIWYSENPLDLEIYNNSKNLVNEQGGVFLVLGINQLRDDYTDLYLRKRLISEIFNAYFFPSMTGYKHWNESSSNEEHWSESSSDEEQELEAEQGWCYDNKYYCGKYVSRCNYARGLKRWCVEQNRYHDEDEAHSNAKVCPGCDGQCGPKDGCQCVECYYRTYMMS